VAKFQVRYRRGSFDLADHCHSYNEAVARALYLRTLRGVWFVRVDGANGTPVLGGFDVEAPWAGVKLVMSNGLPGRGAPSAPAHLHSLGEADDWLDSREQAPI
jgi:hypothetical protein